MTVQALDAYNNLTTNNSSLQVSMAIGTNPGGGTLSGDGPVTVIGGVATFSNLAINNADNGYTLGRLRERGLVGNIEYVQRDAHRDSHALQRQHFEQQHGRIDHQRNGHGA